MSLISALFEHPLLIAGFSILVGAFVASIVTKQVNTRIGTAVAAVLFVLLVVGRLWLGYEGVEYVADVNKWLLAGVAAIVGYVYWLLRENDRARAEKGAEKKEKEGESAGIKWKGIDGIVIVVLLVVAGAQALIGVGGKNFQNDQYFHIEAAKGIHEIGEPARWNFTTDEPQLNKQGENKLYKRAYVYTWQVAQSVRVFGWSESSARVPSVLWYMAFVALAYTVVLKWSGNRILAGLFAASFLFFDFLLMQARITRMYTMLLFVGNLAMLAWYRVYADSLRTTVSLRLFVHGLFAAGLLLLGILTHFLFFLFGVGYAAFIVYELVGARWFAAKKERPHVRMVWCGLLVVGVVGGVAVVSQVWPFVFTEIGFVDAARTRYELYPFTGLPFQYFALALYVVGAFTWVRSQQLSRRYAAVVSLAVLAFFVFFVDRYQAIRYVLFLVPMIWLIVFTTAYELFVGLAARFGAKKPAIMAACVVAFFLMPFSLPVDGIADSFVGTVVQEARMIDTHAYGNGHNFEKAYNYIRERKTDDQVVYAQSFRTYYWQNDPELVVVDMEEQEKLTFPELQKHIEEHGSGWFVWSEGKSHHIRDKIKNYLDENAENHSNTPELQDSNMVVYFLQ